MPTSARLLACAFAALLPALVAAQTPPIKPGLWEVRSEAAAGAEARPSPEARLQSLPPAARAQVEAMMKQKGVAMGAGGANRICFSKESMDPSRWGHAETCKTDFGTRSSSAWKWHSVCTKPDVVVDGEAVFAGPESYTVNTSTTMTMNGQTRTSTRRMQARWVGADCGDLKPFDPKR